MKKISIVGVLVESANWVLHPIANYKELQEYRQNYERQVLDFRDLGEKLKEKLETEKMLRDKTEKKYVKTLYELGKTEKTLQEYTSAFPGELHDYLDMQVKLEEWEKQGTLKDDEIRGMKTTIRSLEQKVIYRNNVIEGLRNSKYDLQQKLKDCKQDLDKARNQVVDLAKKVDFYEKQAKKTSREKIDYTLMAKKTVKRSKKNEK